MTNLVKVVRKSCKKSSFKTFDSRKYLDLL